VHPILFHLGAILIPSYGAVTALGVLLALYLAQRTARLTGVDAGKLWNLSVIALFAALVCSRLLLIALNWSALRLHPAWLLGLATVHHPLLTGFAAFAATLAAIVYAHRQPMPLLRSADALAAPVALGLAFEQLGALLAGSGFGSETTVRWAVTYSHPLAALWSGAPLGVAVHPVQAYSALGFFALAILSLVLCQDANSQSAEQEIHVGVKCQGTTSVVPPMPQVEVQALAPARKYFKIFRFPRLSYRRQPGDLSGIFLLGAAVIVFITEFWRDPEGRGILLGGTLDGPQAAMILLVIAGGFVLMERNPTCNSHEAVHD